MGTSRCLPDDRTFLDYVARLRALSCLRITTEVNPGDALLTLCTCVGEERLLVVGKKK